MVNRQTGVDAVAIAQQWATIDCLTMVGNKMIAFALDCSPGERVRLDQVITWIDECRELAKHDLRNMGVEVR